MKFSMILMPMGALMGRGCGILVIILAGLSFWPLSKANKFFIDGDEENLKKWKNIHTVMIVLALVLPLLILALLDAGDLI